MGLNPPTSQSLNRLSTSKAITTIPCFLGFQDTNEWTAHQSSHNIPNPEDRQPTTKMISLDVFLYLPLMEGIRLTTWDGAKTM